MLTKAGLEFLLRITDFFGGHWEDPGWGQQPLNQLLLMVSVHTLAEGLADDGARRRIQGALGHAIAETAQQVTRER